MWILITILSSAILLRALSRRSKLLLVLYGLSILVGIYTFALFALVIAAHGVYILLLYLRQINTRPIKLPGNLVSYALSTIIALILFLPWVYLLVKNLSKARENLVWMNFDIGIAALVKLWGFNLSSAFLDIGLVPKIQLPIELPLTSIEFMNSPHLDQFVRNYPLMTPVYFIIKILVVILILYSIFYLIRNAQKRSYLFLCSLIVIPFIGITFQDLIVGGVGSTIAGYRFFVPVIIGIELAVAYLLASQISRERNLQTRLWQVITVFILICGLFSCITYLKADSWWTLRYGYHVKRIAPIINNSNDPLVITKFESQVLAFPHHLNPEVRLITLNDLDKFQLPEHTGDIFIYDLTPEIRESLENLPGVRIEEVNADDRLWRLR